MGGYLSHGCEGIGGERNFGFDSLKYMNCEMPPVTARHHPREAPPSGSGQPIAGSVRFSLLQIDLSHGISATVEKELVGKELLALAP